MKYSVSEENYLKVIYHLQDQSGLVSTTSLAKALKTKPASVTEMTKKLKSKKLLHYQPYRGFRLTQEGNKAALGIIRRHRLWEYFLAEKLRFSWEEVHELAEELEHVRHKKLIDRLDAFLGFPRLDPHGDPIPDKDGQLATADVICLTELPENTSALISRVTNQSFSLLEMLRQRNMKIGTPIEILKRNAFDESLDVRINRQRSINLSKTIAEQIFVVVT
ncbi:MAG: metal-dependent transcriptional regulator [Chitinophagaceae bacterium]|nr:metal-dependent transcriptional regulator [Chitinophagaceae bacterium]